MFKVKYAFILSGMVPPTRFATRWARRFRKEEDGALILFTLFVLFLMLMAGGIAIDMMRYETNRAQLQNTADNAVLAAAGSDLQADKAAIVKDYFDKAGLAAYLDTIGDDDIGASVNATKVAIRANRTLDTYLMRLSGVDTLNMHIAATAMRHVSKLEVALVLDNSGSMLSNKKLTNMQTAAREFVNTLMTSSEEGNAVISVVPFSHEVAPPQSLFDAMSVNVQHNYSTCLSFSDDDFNTTAIDADVEQTQLIHTATSQHAFGNLNYGAFTCYTQAKIKIMPFSSDATALDSYIAGLGAGGNTSGHLGLKWGAALLDPAFQPVVETLKNTYDDGKQVVSNNVGTIPAAYGTYDTLKIVVMMGDGENTPFESFLHDSSYRYGSSPLYDFQYENNDGTIETEYYLYDPRYDKYRELGKRGTNTGTDGSGEILTPAEFRDLRNSKGFVSSDQLTWGVAWGLMTPYHLSYMIGDSAFRNEFNGAGKRSSKKINMLMGNICDAIKAQGVIIYTIGFEVPADGTAEQSLRSCASSSAHYFSAQGTSISDAFNTIAQNVTQLRLTK